MKTYNCKVRLNGSLFNVVSKKGVTAAEIVVLKHIHGRSANGAAPVVDITPAADVKRTETQERNRLAGIYSHGELKGAALVKEVLGVAGVPLPQYVPEVDEPVEIEEEIVEVKQVEAPSVKPKRTKIEPKTEEAATAA